MALLAAATEAGAQAREDQVVLDWNVTMLQVTVAGTNQARGLAMVHVAMFDAVNAIDPFLPSPVYVAGAGPAAYQLTPPALVNPIIQNARLFVPFVMTHSSQFRPNGSPDLDSRRFVDAYNEVRTMGIACPNPAACARTPEQTTIALWHTEQSFPQLNCIARILTLQGPADILETARNFALPGLATGDGLVSSFEAKYFYRFVRPVTAIRAGDADGVPGTAGDPTWTPQLVTLPHPQHPSARAVNLAAPAQVIKNAFGSHTSFDTTAPAVPGVTRHFDDNKPKARLAPLKVAPAAPGLSTFRPGPHRVECHWAAGRRRRRRQVPRHRPRRPWPTPRRPAPAAAARIWPTWAASWRASRS